MVRDLNAEGPAGPIPLRLYRFSKAGGSLPVLVYFHGGGFVLGSIETHDHICRELAKATGFVIVSVEYRLGPEHKFPAGILDGIAATKWIADNAESLGGDSAWLAVGGDSAGATLSAVIALDARDNNGPAIKAQVLVYPKTDHSDHLRRYANYPEGYRLNRALIEFYEGGFLRSDEDRLDWRASPLLASSHGRLPPALVLTAGFDPLVNEGEDYAMKLAQAGTLVTFKRFPGQLHGFLGYGGVAPEANEAIAAIADFLRCRLDA